MMTYPVVGSDADLVELQVFPPAFHDSPLAYGFGLFGLMMIATLSAGRAVYVSRQLKNSHDPWGSPVNVYRLEVLGWLLFAFMSTLPDLLVLILWNEIPMPVMLKLWATDRVFDGLAMIPFLFALVILVRSEHPLEDQLRRMPVVKPSYSTWLQIKRQLTIVGLVMLIAILMAIGKTSIIVGGG